MLCATLPWPAAMPDAFHDCSATLAVACPLASNVRCGASPVHLHTLDSVSQQSGLQVWDISIRQCMFTLSGHTHLVSCVKWGGDGLIHTSSRDGSIMVWDAKVCSWVSVGMCISTCV